MAGYDFQLVVRDIYSTSTALDDMPTKEVFLDINETTGSMGFGGEARTDTDGPHYDFYGPVHFRAGSTGQTVYSVEELDTGSVWIDGRPIYRVCGMQVRAMAAGTMTDIDLGIDPIENIICADVYLRQGAAWRPANYPNRNTTSVHTWLINGSDTEPTLRIIMGNDMAADAVGYNIEYTKAADTPTYYWLPFLASNNDQGCVASASSIYTAGNQAFGAFNGAIDSWWASAGADTDRWVQVQMPYALKNMVVTLIDREDVSGDHRRANTAGAFLGSNDGAGWTELFSFTDRNPDFVNGFATTYQLNNATAYKYLRYAPAAGSYSSDFATSVADIRIEGEVFDAQNT